MDASGREGMRAWSPLFFSLVLIFGMVLGFNLRDTLRSKRDINTVLERNDRLEQVIDLINEKYVDSVNSDILYKDAISGILKTLDPHTVYIPAEDLQDATEDLEGGFSGIGVEFSIVRDTINVTAVIDKGPANAAGLNVGDQLLKVGDTVVAGVNITAQRITHLLKGKQKTKVSVTLKQISSGEPRVVSITRDMIPLHSVEASLMLDATTGYMKINRFSATTHKEFMEAIKKLKTSGAKQMVIDLRSNPGGYLGEATSVADEFIDDSKLLVYTQGTHASKTEYNADKKGAFETGKLIVLIDESSASASEIFAGAIQDWDRGVIMGRRSFGKGLVQEPYEMTDGSELRLTIAKYYTPSGRCIQRSFANGKAAYAADYEKRFTTDELTGKEQFINADTTRYFTANHRVVYGGGGIKPDVFVPVDTVKLSHTLVNSLYSSELKNAIWDYFLRNRPDMKFSTVEEFDASFDGAEEVIHEYMKSLSASTRNKIWKEIYKTQPRHYFDTYIRSQIAHYLFKDNGYYAITLKDDNVVEKALNVLHSNTYSHIISGK